MRSIVEGKSEAVSRRRHGGAVSRVPLNDLARRTSASGSVLAEAFQRVAGSGRLILGSEVEAFEAAFARYCDVTHCVGVANGTDALELALRALGCGDGDEVATVANAGGYATLAILATGATPAYVDIDPETYTMSAEALRHALTPNTKAVVVTHLYGHLANMADILAVTRSAGIKVVEDCAQAHGAECRGRRAGAFGDLGCFSFYPSKNLGALGDAGAVVTKDDELAARLRRSRHYGWRDRFHVADAGGRNSRLDELQAAVLSALLPQLDAWNDRRRTIVARYRVALEDLDLAVPLVEDPKSYVGHLCVVRSPDRDALRRGLTDRGVGTDIHYPVADYRQAPVVERIGEITPLPETEKAIGEILTIPCFPEMTDAEVDYVIEAIRHTLAGPAAANEST